MSFMYGTVGGHPQNFHAGVDDLEITGAKVVEQLPDVRVLLQEFQMHLREAAIPAAIVQPHGGSILWRMQILGRALSIWKISGTHSR